MTTGTGRSQTQPPAKPLHVRFERFQLDEANATLLREGKAVALAPTPFKLLCAFARRPGVLLAKHALLDAVWGHQYVSASVLKTAISDLRTALEDDPRQPRFIETVSRRGYRFIASPLAMPGSPIARRDAPAALADAPLLVGRKQALARLHAAWESASAGKRSVVWVAGDPGIGKTTLIEHFAASLGDVQCARGQCVEQYGDGEPYLPVLEALADLCRKDANAAPLVRAVAPTWLLQLPWLTSVEERDALRRDLEGSRPERMLREMGELLDRYSGERPLLLVVEDLHWSDRATLQLIDSIARRRGAARLLWLASFRLAEVVALDHPLNHLRRELRLHGLCEEIVLDNFSEREVAEYVALRAPSMHADDSLVRAMHERTDGLPLFVASLTSDLLARTSAAAPAAAEILLAAVPENLAAILDHYIDKLSEEQRELLSAAAACGVDFHVPTLAAVLERDLESANEVCAGLAREHRWLVERSEGQYAFRHALLRQALLDRMAHSARSQLHRQIGAALERQRAAGVPVSAMELATHFERGGEAMPAARYYAEAAQAALALFHAEECMTLAERGRALLEQAREGSERDTLEITLSTLWGLSATRALGAGGAAKAALARACALLDRVPQHPAMGRLLHGFGFLLFLRAEYAEALAVADRSEALASSTDDSVLLLSACTVRGQVHHLQGRPQEARSWLERGFALAGPLDVAPGEFLADPQVMLLGFLSTPLAHLGCIRQARECLERADARARGRGRGWPMARLVALWQSALFEVRLGNAERVSALADEMQALVEQYSLAHGETGWRGFRGWADARLGKAAGAHRRIREAFEDNTRLGMLAGGSEVLGYAAEALLLAGDRQGARAQLQEAYEVAYQRQERVYLPQLFLIDAAIARAGGDSAAADEAVRHAVAEARTQEARWLELLAMLELCAHGDTEKARQALAALVEQLPEAAGTVPIEKAKALLR